MRHFFLSISKLLIIPLAITFSQITLSDEYALPDLARYDNERSLSNPSYILGQYWFRTLNGSSSLIEFPPAYNYLMQAISELAPNTSLRDKTIDFALLNSSQTNAFVIPGNHLFIYSDLLRLIDNESSLMALLAHEISHLELNHYERSLDNQQNEQNKTFMLLLAGIAAASMGGDSETTSALWLGGIANQQENMLTYSRNQEQEADRRGRDLLIDSGKTTNGMDDLFSALMKESMGTNRVEFLSTHPLPENRLSDNLTGEKKTSILFQASSDDFRYFRATLLAYRSVFENTEIESFLKRNIPSADTYQYAVALSQLLTHKESLASNTIKNLNTSNEYVDYLKALVLLATNKNSEAKFIVNQRLNIAPDNLMFQYLSSQLGSESEYISSNNFDFSYEKRMAYRHNIAVAKQKGNQPYALYSHALLEFSFGKDKPSLNLINRAIKLSDGNQKAEMEKVKVTIERIEEAQKKERIQP